MAVEEAREPLLEPELSSSPAPETPELEAPEPEAARRARSPIWPASSLPKNPASLPRKA